MTSSKNEIIFNSNGTQLSVQINSVINKYNLSVPWDITTAIRGKE